LKEIDEEEYLSILNQLAAEKWNSLKGEQYLTRTAKTTHYLLQKGYESALINQSISALRKEKE